MSKIKCQYCEKDAVLVTGEAIYPRRRDLWSKKFYKCRTCDAYVGVHDGTEKPKGQLADAETRFARREAHAAFDHLLRSGHMKREDACLWLAKQFRRPKGQVHIGWMSPSECEKVVEVVTAYFAANGP